MKEVNDIYNKYNNEYYNDNLKWKVFDIAQLYKHENDNLSWEDCIDRAKVLYRELKKINSKDFRDRGKFFRMNTPFSFFDNKDSEFADTPWSGGCK